MKKVIVKSILAVLGFSLLTTGPLFTGTTAIAAATSAKSKPTSISDSITMKVSKRTTYSKPKAYTTNAKSSLALYKARLFSHASKVTFTLTGFTKPKTTYKITKLINAQGVNWYYLKGCGWIIGGSHPSHDPIR
ncbi:hypothetical protein [Lentilactobacillus farraginis]|nr:hypothetical protein [Lentilactobacillus farraginis]